MLLHAHKLSDNWSVKIDHKRIWSIIATAECTGCLWSRDSSLLIWVRVVTTLWLVSLVAWWATPPAQLRSGHQPAETWWGTDQRIVSLLLLLNMFYLTDSTLGWKYWFSCITTKIPWRSYFCDPVFWLKIFRFDQYQVLCL